MIPLALFSGIALGWCLRVAVERANARVEGAMGSGEDDLTAEIIRLDDYRTGHGWRSVN